MLSLINWHPPIPALVGDCPPFKGVTCPQGSRVCLDYDYESGTKDEEEA